MTRRPARLSATVNAAEAMRAEGASLGGESSGHILSLDLSPTGDGLNAALKVAGVKSETGKPSLRAFRKVLGLFPKGPPRSGWSEKKPPSSRFPVSRGAIRDLERELGSSGRVLVRYSGHGAEAQAPSSRRPTDAVVRSEIDRLMAAAGAEPAEA